MKLHYAKLCVKCNELFTGQECPKCGYSLCAHPTIGWISNSRDSHNSHNSHNSHDGHDNYNNKNSNIANDNKNEDMENAITGARM